MGLEAQPLVSVCIPTFNDAGFLPYTLASILDQSYPRIEVVVGDDGSSDETPAIVASFADPRIRYHRNERNLGQFANVNACIERSAGEFVSVYHSDDVYDATIVEEEVAFLTAHPEAGAVFALDRWIDPTGRVIGETHLPPDMPDVPCLAMDQVLRLLLRHKNRLLRGPTFMARRTVFGQVGLFEPDTYPMANDLEYWLRVLTRFRVGIIRRHLMSYRQDPSQVSSQYNHLRTTEEDFFAVMDRYLSDPAIAAHADDQSLIEYAFHRCDDETSRAANLVIRGELGEARSLLARPFPWHTLAGGITRRKARVLLLRSVLRVGIATRAQRPLTSVLLRTERPPPPVLSRAPIVTITGRRRTAGRSAWYFDRVASGYLARYGAETPGGRAFRERKERVLQLLGDASGRVLDVGCGPGVMAGDLVGERGCTFVGADASPRMVEEGRRRFQANRDIAFIVADAGALPCADAAFDIVLCIGVIDRVEQPALAVAEMSRVLRPGGTLLISFPNLLSPYAVWRNYVFLPAVGFLKWGLRAVTGRTGGPTLLSPARLWRRRRAMRLLAAHVGRVEETEALNFNLLLSPLDELLPGIAMEMAERVKWLGATRLRWLGAAFLARVTKMQSTLGSAPVRLDPRLPRSSGANGGRRA